MIFTVILHNAVLVGLPAYLYNRLQSVLNAAARSIAGLRRSDHITDTLASFHWLKAPECAWRVATIVYRSLNGMTPSCLAGGCRSLRLRSSLTDQLDVRQCSIMEQSAKRYCLFFVFVFLCGPCRVYVGHVKNY